MSEPSGDTKAQANHGTGDKSANAPPTLVEAVPAEATQAEPRDEEESTAKRRPDDPSAVVGIGASAGGLEALTTLFKAIRTDIGLAFVIVQHLDPRHESQMPQLLGRLTKMPVQEAQDGTRLRANHIYMIPPDHLMTIEDGTLHLHDRPLGPGHQGAIDMFLNSLAKDMGERAMAVILSGTLSDGRDGLVAVRQADGFTFAQDLDSARHAEMPRSAIRTGFVDFVLPPDAIAKQIARLAEHLVDPDDVLDRRSEPEKGKLFRMVLQATGIDLAQYKDETLDRRIRRRILLTQNPDLAEYVTYCKKNRDELPLLVEDALINVTEFFRDPDVFDAIQENVLNQLLVGRQNQEPVRIWVAGCSTGQEPYSIAMMVDQFQREHNLRFPVNIFATDLSEKAIGVARLGIYSAKDLENVPRRLVKEYFHPIRGAFQISKQIRGMIIFAVHDLTSDPPFSTMDLVSCRNLLIYLRPEVQTQVLGALHYALRAGGFLVLGSAETPGKMEGSFRETHRKHRIFEKRQGIAAQPLRLRAPVRGAQHLVVQPANPRDDLTSESDVIHAADRRLLDGLIRCSVIVDAQFRIMSIRGEGGRYLRLGHGTGEPALLRALRGGSADIRRALEEARRRGRSKSMRLTFLAEDGSPSDGLVDVMPIGSGTHCVVAFREPYKFEDRTESPQTPASLLDVVFGGVRKENTALRARVAELEVRLDAVIQDYDTTMEELRSANEEAMSTNEELQSTNEELQTATEESQSTAEELRTLNDELVQRNKEIQKVNDDMMNILNIVELPILVVDNQLRITRMTSGTERLFKLDHDALGRNLQSVAMPFQDIDLNQVVGKVMRSLQKRQEVANDRHGQAWHLAVHPYRTAENRIEGAIIVCEKDSGPN